MLSELVHSFSSILALRPSPPSVQVTGAGTQYQADKKELSQHLGHVQGYEREAERNYICRSCFPSALFYCWLLFWLL